MSIDANTLLMGGGVTSAKFPTIGTTVTGQIVRPPEARQQTDIKDGTPLTFANGDPRMQVVVQLQTTERDPQDGEDDGIRGLYIKGNMLNAVREAVRKVGAKGLETGGTLSVTYTGDGERKNKAFDPPKLYAATYLPPKAAAANDVLMGQAPTMAAVAPPSSPAPMPPAPPGVDPAMWARMAPEQQAAVLAAMGQTPPF